MEMLKELDSLAIREKKEYTSLPSTAEWKPIFCLTGIMDEEVFYVAPFKKSVPAIETLSAGKSYTLHVLDKKGKQVLYYQKKIGFFRDEMEVSGESENFLGLVKKIKIKTKAKQPVMYRYQILNAAGQEMYEVREHLNDPEIFHIYKANEVTGKISKRPTSTVEEGIMKHDHFGIVFPFNADVAGKAVLIGALFLIDFLFLGPTQIERKK